MNETVFLTQGVAAQLSVALLQRDETLVVFAAAVTLCQSFYERLFLASSDMTFCD